MIIRGSGEGTKATTKEILLNPELNSGPVEAGNNRRKQNIKNTSHEGEYPYNPLNTKLRSRQVGGSGRKKTRLVAGTTAGDL